MESRVAGGPTTTDVAAREGWEVLGEVVTAPGAFVAMTIADTGTDRQIDVVAFVARDGQQVAGGATVHGARATLLDGWLEVAAVARDGGLEVATTRDG